MIVDNTFATPYQRRSSVPTSSCTHDEVLRWAPDIVGGALSSMTSWPSN